MGSARSSGTPHFDAFEGKGQQFQNSPRVNDLQSHITLPSSNVMIDQNESMLCAIMGKYDEATSL